MFDINVVEISALDPVHCCNIPGTYTCCVHRCFTCTSYAGGNNRGGGRM